VISGFRREADDSGRLYRNVLRNYHYTLRNIPEGRRWRLIQKWNKRTTTYAIPMFPNFSSRFCVSAVQVPMFGSANTTKGERKVADEAAAKEREECAKRSFVNCS